MVIVVVAFAAFLDYFLYGMIIPLSPYSRAAVTSEAMLATLYSGYAIGVLVATPVFGYAGDRFGLRRQMIVGALLTCLAALAFWLAPNPWVLFLGKLCQGAASAATWTVGLSLVAAHYVDKRVTMMGYALMGGTAGLLLGPIAGGGLHALGGYSVPLLLVTGLTFVSLAMCALLLPRDQPPTGPLPDLRPVLLNRTVIVAAVAVALSAFGWGILEPLLPSRLRNLNGATALEVGLVFAVGAVAYGLASPFVGRVCERFRIKPVIAGGTLAMAITVPLLGLGEGTLWIGFAVCLVNVAYAFMLNPTSAELGNAVDRLGLKTYGAVYAVYNIAYSLGMMGTAAFAAAVVPRVGFFTTLLIVSAVLLVSIPFLLRKEPS